MSDENIIRELKENNKTLGSIRTFLIVETQLTKSLVMEVKKQGRDIQKIKSLMEEKNGNNRWKIFRKR